MDVADSTAIKVMPPSECKVEYIFEKQVGEIYVTPEDCIVYRCHCCDENYLDAGDFGAHINAIRSARKLKSEAFEPMPAEGIEETIEDYEQADEHMQIEPLQATATDDQFEIIEEEDEFLQSISEQFNDSSGEECAEAEQNSIESQRSSTQQTNVLNLQLDRKQMLNALHRLRKLRKSAFKQYKCGKCEFISTSQQRLSEHHFDEHGEHLNKCDVCGAGFKMKANLKMHMLRHTKPTKKFCCAYCGNRFLTRTELTIHERKHTGEKPYVCNDCGKGFTTSGLLSEHKKRESNERPFGCELCDKSFKFRHLLKNHLVVHTGERNFVCDVCGARFARYKDCSNHKKIHENARSYACKHCPMAFNQKPALFTHMRNKHKNIEK